MDTVKIAVVTAGLSEPSATALLGVQLREATEKALSARSLSADFEVIPLRTLFKEITSHYLTGFPTGQLALALDAVRDSDAVIAVTPTFKAGYTGMFKSFWDLIDDDALLGKPTLLAATGGTARHSLMIDTAMRPLFAYFKAQLVSTGVFAATDDFGADTSLQSRIDRAGGELASMLAWKVGADPVDEDAEGSSGPVFDDRGGANSGSFFGIAVESSQADESSGKVYKAPGLEPLKVTPFEKLLGSM